MPKVATPFDGVPDGQVHPRHFKKGDTVSGDLARVAAAEGWLEGSKPKAAPKAKAPAKRKAKKPAAPKAAAASPAKPAEAVK